MHVYSPDEVLLFHEWINCKILILCLPSALREQPFLACLESCLEMQNDTRGRWGALLSSALSQQHWVPRSPRFA